MVSGESSPGGRFPCASRVVLSGVRNGVQQRVLSGTQPAWVGRDCLLAIPAESRRTLASKRVWECSWARMDREQGVGVECTRFTSFQQGTCRIFKNFIEILRNSSLGRSDFSLSHARSRRVLQWERALRGTAMGCVAAGKNGTRFLGFRPDFRDLAPGMKLDSLRVRA